jgi:hypothetical protein
MVRVISDFVTGALCMLPGRRAAKRQAVKRFGNSRELSNLRADRIGPMKNAGAGDLMGNSIR